MINLKAYYSQEDIDTSDGGIIIIPKKKKYTDSDDPSINQGQFSRGRYFLTISYLMEQQKNSTYCLIVIMP